MEFYSYDENGIYNGIAKGQKNPRGAGYLQPANSTELEPPNLSEGELAKFENDSWIKISDEFYAKTKILETDENGVLVYKLDENGFVVDKTAEEQAAELKTIQEGQLYAAMVSEIYTEMKTVFGTDNDVSASAFAATWEAMIKRPANYVDAELGFADEAAVTAYANAKISAADAYGVFRMKRIAKFEADKAAL